MEQEVFNNTIQDIWDKLSDNKLVLVGNGFMQALTDLANKYNPKRIRRFSGNSHQRRIKHRLYNRSWLALKQYASE